jgi:hypothetical protein
MRCVLELQKLGYRLWVAGDKLKYEQHSGKQADLALARPLLNELRNHKAEAVQYLQRQIFVQNICRQFDNQGVARFHSVKLDEVVYILRDYDDRLLTLPADALAFSLRELQSMVTQTYTDSELRELAQAKKEILQAQRAWLAERQKAVPAGVQAALKVFPGAVVLDMDKPPSAKQEPAKTCFACKGSSFWTQAGGGQVCGTCHPQPRTSER